MQQDPFQLLDQSLIAPGCINEELCGNLCYILRRLKFPSNAKVSHTSYTIFNVGERNVDPLIVALKFHFELRHMFLDRELEGVHGIWSEGNVSVSDVEVVSVCPSEFLIHFLAVPFHFFRVWRVHSGFNADQVCWQFVKWSV